MLFYLLSSLSTMLGAASAVLGARRRPLALFGFTSALCALAIANTVPGHRHPAAAAAFAVMASCLLLVAVGACARRRRAAAVDGGGDDA